MLIERSALGLLEADMGDTVTVKTSDGKIRQMRIAGLVHDLNAQMYVFDGVAIGYTTTDTLDWLGQPHDFEVIAIFEVIVVLLLIMAFLLAAALGP